MQTDIKNNKYNLSIVLEWLGEKDVGRIVVIWAVMAATTAANIYCSDLFLSMFVMVSIIFIEAGD